MREILFKAKKTVSGEWLEGYYAMSIDQNGVKKHSILVIDTMNFGYLNRYIIDPNTLCQYTGLTDKNGNMIWENDILFIDKYSNRNGTGKGVVKFYQGCFTSFYGQRFLERDRFDYLHDVNSEREVIGNVFDNPELLEDDLEDDWEDWEDN